MKSIRVWLPAVRTGSGADVFTMRLARLLESGGAAPTITWLPHWAELAPHRVPFTAPADVDIVHANSWNAYAFAGDSRRLVVTVHHCVHDESFIPHKSWAQRLYHRGWIRRMEERSFEVASTVTAVSEFTRRSVASVFGFEDIQVIPNWIDTDVFCPLLSARTARAAFRLLFVGNWGQRKGADVLPGLMRCLGSQFELVYTTGLRGRSVPTALPENMKWSGKIKDEPGMADLYRQCDALLVPSLLEGFGYAALEAMACGKPIIAFNTSSLPELVEDGVTGRLVPVKDIDALAMACRELADNPVSLREMGEAARDRVLRRFSPETALSRYLAVYKALL